MPLPTVRLTVAEALGRFLAAQYVDARHPFLAGVLGAGPGGGLRAALAGAAELPTRSAVTVSGAVHTAVAYARATGRRGAYACVTEAGPDCAELVAGAAAATGNRLPVLLLPGEAVGSGWWPGSRPADPGRGGTGLADCLRPVSRLWARVERAEQVPAVLAAALRVLTDPAETGAVTVVLPDCVAREEADWPGEWFGKRVWLVPRPEPAPLALRDAARMIRAARRPVVVAGGGVVYAAAERTLENLAGRWRIPVLETRSGKGVVRWDRAVAGGSLGAGGGARDDDGAQDGGVAAAAVLAARADLVIGVGTRYRAGTEYANPDVRFLNINVCAADAAVIPGGDHAPARAHAVVGGADRVLYHLEQEKSLRNWQAPPDYVAEYEALIAADRAAAEADRRPGPEDVLTVGAVVAAVNDACPPLAGTVVEPAGAPPDLRRLWRAWEPAGYHGCSPAAGSEVAAGIGVKLADPDREVFVVTRASAFLAAGQELATAAGYGIELTVVLLDDRPVGCPSRNAEGLGAEVFHAETFAELTAALAAAKRVRRRPAVVRVPWEPAAG